MYNDRELLAKTLMAEAGNQGPLGMLAAGSVIMNRVRSGNYGQGLQGVILKPGAFSPWNSVTGFAGGEQGQDMARITPSEQAYRIADALLSGQYEDPTGNATHFYNPDISDPSWGIRGGNEWRRIGEHVFGRADDRVKGPSRVINVGSDAPKLVASDTMAALGKGGGAVTPDQIAQSAQAQSTGMQEENPKGLMGLFGNPDLMANLAIAFNSMRLNPDPNLPAILSAQMKERRGERKDKQELNKTVAMLESIGADPRLIELAKAGYAKEAIAQAYKAPKDAQVVEVDGRLIRYDPKTGTATQIYGPQVGADTLSKDQMATLNSLRDDLRTELKPFEIVKQGYNNITEFYNNPSATGDYALAVAFAKILDPGSVAREGEVAAVQNAGARIPALGQALKNAITGEGQLTQEVRQQIAELATAIYKERAQEAGNIISGYGEIARRGNVPAELLYSGNIPEARKVIPAIVPPAAQRQGVTQEMWNKATPEEKQAWMD